MIELLDHLNRPIRTGDIICHGGSGEFYWSIAELAEGDLTGYTKYLKENGVLTAFQLNAYHPKYNNRILWDRKKIIRKSWEICGKVDEATGVQISRFAEPIKPYTWISTGPHVETDPWNNVSETWMMVNVIRFSPDELTHLGNLKDLILLSERIKSKE